MTRHMRNPRRSVFGRSHVLPLFVCGLAVCGLTTSGVRAQESEAEGAPEGAQADAPLSPDVATTTATDKEGASLSDDAARASSESSDNVDGADTAESTSREAASSEDTAAEPTREEPSLLEASVDQFRTPVDRLTEHYLGSTSRPVRFDWRNSLFILGVHGGELIERNNFGSFRLGAVVRRAFLSVMFEAGASYVFVLGTESSELLALTPYRQASRPPRVEFDVNISYPLFEGVVTPVFDFIPASEMVFSVTGGGRYLLYPQAVIGDRNWDRSSTWTDTQTWQDIGSGLATAQLLDADRRLLERRGLPGMQIDRATVHTLAGFTFDAYYQPGLFFSARALLAIPALYLVSGTRLGFWWETTLVAGWAF
jgi:hypothetical protein